VGGERFELHHGKGETDDHTWTWVPGRGVLCTGDFFIWASPNAGNPQKAQRYPREWAHALRDMQEVDAQVLLPGHGPPVVGAGRVAGGPGVPAVLLAGIGVTAFDGASEGPLFNDALPHLQTFFGDLGLGPQPALELGFTVGLLAGILLVTLIWLLAVRGMPRVDGARPGRPLVQSLIPILAAYVVAHYFSLLAYQGQDLWRLASDPLGDGSDLFGGADASIDYGVVSATQIWYVQVVALVAGHVAALVLAHDRALALYRSHRDATRSQVVMLVLMVCFTCLGLWLLSAANG